MPFMKKNRMKTVVYEQYGQWVTFECLYCKEAYTCDVDYVKSEYSCDGCTKWFKVAVPN